MMSIGGMILQNWPVFEIGGDDLANLTARLPKFLPTTVKYNKVKTKKKGHHFPDDQFLAQNVLKTQKKKR